MFWLSLSIVNYSIYFLFFKKTNNNKKQQTTPEHSNIQKLICVLIAKATVEAAEHSGQPYCMPLELIQFAAKFHSFKCFKDLFVHGNLCQMPPATDRSSRRAVSLTSQQVLVCVCMDASWASLHVCQRVKRYQTSHHYKLIPQPQEGLHNGQCVVGVTQAPPSNPGSGLRAHSE